MRPGVTRAAGCSLLAAFTLTSPHALAEAPWDAATELRLRVESQEGFNKKRYEPGYSGSRLEERARVQIGWRPHDAVSLFLQGQDAHGLFNDLGPTEFPNGSPYDNPLDIQQLWVALQPPGTRLSLKLGRQVIAFGDDRLLGPGDWSNVGRYTWDAARLSWQTPTIRGDAFFARRVRRETFEIDHRHYDFDAWGLVSELASSPLSIRAYYVFKRGREGDDERRHSLGVTANVETDSGLEVAAGVVPQLGTKADAGIEALGEYASVGYTFPVEHRPCVRLTQVYGSGDSRPGEDAIRTFDGVFGAVAKYYGRMNLFSWMNLHDLGGSVAIEPARDLAVSLDYHAFFLAQPGDAWYYANGRAARSAPPGNMERAVGQEIDLTAKARVSGSWKLQAGCACFAPGEFVQVTGESSPAHWGFVQGTYSASSVRKE